MYKELAFRASASSGPGGQNVNRVNTKVEIRFDVNDSKILTDTEKEQILKSLINRINNKGILIISAQTERTQLRNKEMAVNLFYKLIEQALRIKKKRIAVRPSKSMVKKRLDRKKILSLKKQSRKKPDLDIY